MVPSPGRIALAVAGAFAVAVFAIAAPFGGNPARRLWRIDAVHTVESEFDLPSARTPDLSPSNEWVATDSTDVDSTTTLSMPPLAVRGEAPSP
jgi:hypothetical protein